MIGVWALVAAVVVGQHQRPLPREAPSAMVATVGRVHVRVDESIDPDRLRDLARPNVTLWLSTSSNTLKASTLENVARFDVSWVQLRAPLRPIDAAVFARAPRAGAWLINPRREDRGLAARLPGVRRLALKLEGPFPEEPLEPFSELTWAPSEPPDLLTWSRVLQLPGRTVFKSPVLLPTRCAARTSDQPALELHVANLLALSSDVFPCGTGTRVVVQPSIEPWLLQSLVVRDPSVELVIEVGADSARAVAARDLLERLTLGPSR